MAEKKAPIIKEFKFAPVEEFEWSREILDDDGEVIESTLIGQYLVGNTYNCTKKPIHDALRAKCVEWEKEGKIVITNLPAGQQFKTIQVGK